MKEFFGALGISCLVANITILTSLFPVVAQVPEPVLLKKADACSIKVETRMAEGLNLPDLLPRIPVKPIKYVAADQTPAKQAAEQRGKRRVR